MNAPILGCPGCETTGGRMACPVHAATLISGTVSAGWHCIQPFVEVDRVVRSCMKPEGCECEGPFYLRDAGRWTFGHMREWYQALERCPIHGEPGIEKRIRWSVPPFKEFRGRFLY